MVISICGYKIRISFQNQDNGPLDKAMKADWLDEVKFQADSLNSLLFFFEKALNSSSNMVDILEVFRFRLKPRFFQCISWHLNQFII